MRWKFSTAADHRMMWAVEIRPLSSSPTRAPTSTFSQRTVMLSPDQRLPVDEQALARLGGERRLHHHEQQRSALALLQAHVGVARIGDAALARLQAAEEFDLVATVEQALERRLDRREPEIHAVVATGPVGVRIRGQDVER